MAVETQRPTGNGSVQLTAVGDTNNYQCVDEASADDDTTYNKTPAGGFGTRDDRFTFDWSAIPDGASISQIVVRFRAKLGPNGVEATDQVRALVFDGSLSQLGALQSPVAANYTDYAETYSPGGGDIMPDDGADLKANWQFGYRCASANLGDDDLRITRVEVEITYQPAASDEREIHIVGSAVASGERGAFAAGGDGRYVEHFSNTTYRDAGNTDAKWDGDGVLEMGP